MAQQQSAGAQGPGMKPAARLALGIGGTLVAIAIWAALRAYTGVFGILNVRVFVGAFILVIPLVAAGAFQKIGVPWTALQSLLGVATVIGGEGLGAVLADRPVVLDKFTLIFLGVAVALPWLSRMKTV